MTAASRAREFFNLHLRAHEAGLAAGANAVPRPIVVGSPSTPLGNDIDPSKQTWYVAEGVCGFGWVVIKPGTSAFARWASTHDTRGRQVPKGESGIVQREAQPLARKHYYGGVSIWAPHELGQSLARNAAYANAYAEVLSANGINAYGQSRID